MYSHQDIPRLIEIQDVVMGLDVIRPRNFYYPGESHDFWELVLVCSGRATATADERVYQLETGSLLFHRPMEFHRIWTGPDSEAHLQILSFRASGAGMQKLEGRCLTLETEQMARFFRITQAFPRWDEETGGIEQVPPLRLNLAASLLETLLLELTFREPVQDLHMTGAQQQYSRIVQVMQDHVEENLTVEELAGLCSMSVSNLKRVFRKYSDIGIAKYFCTLRIRRASGLLRQGLTIPETAERMHWPDVSYFHTVFKRETGMTPGQYRKNGQCLFLSSGKIHPAETGTLPVI